MSGVFYFINLSPLCSFRIKDIVFDTEKMLFAHTLSKIAKAFSRSEKLKNPLGSDPEFFRNKNSAVTRIAFYLIPNIMYNASKHKLPAANNTHILISCLDKPRHLFFCVIIMFWAVL